LVLSSGNIYLAGLDFSISDIRTHARPYSFDNLFYGKANRFVSFYSESYSRSRLLHHGGSMDIYAAWFKEQLNKWSKRIYSIGGNKIFEHGEPISRNELKKTDDFFKTVEFENSNDFCEKGIQALLNALKQPEYSQKIKRELNSLLFSGENEITERELETAVKETCIKVLHE